MITLSVRWVRNGDFDGERTYQMRDEIEPIMWLSQMASNPPGVISLSDSFVLVEFGEKQHVSSARFDGDPYMMEPLIVFLMLTNDMYDLKTASILSIETQVKVGIAVREAHGAGYGLDGSNNANVAALVAMDLADGENLSFAYEATLDQVLAAVILLEKKGYSFPGALTIVQKNRYFCEA